jgi:predicted alpha/beta-fold hydrolase
MGVNLVIYNHRGYSRSKLGCRTITPTKVQKDGEMVLQYVRSNFVTGKMGVHGQSIGGMVSLYVAKKC